MSSKRLTALLDGDILIYQAAASAEQPVQWSEDLWTLHSNLSDATEHFESAVAGIVSELAQLYESDVRVIVALSDKRNFRKELNPLYKANRASKRQPLCRQPLYEYAIKNYPIRIFPSLEADDTLGILMTSRGDSHDCISGKRVLVSVDKDFKTIQGDHYNYVKKEIFTVDKYQADYNFFMQTLTGDATDGYAGCPTVGPKTAEKILSRCCMDRPEEMWEAVLHAYTSKGLPESEALMNARMARILRYGDYNFDKGEVILWNPPVRTTA